MRRKDALLGTYSLVELNAIPTGQIVGALGGLHCCVYVNLNVIVDVCHAVIPKRSYLSLQTVKAFLSLSSRWLSERDVRALYACKIVPLPTVTSLVVFKNTVGSKSLGELLNMHLLLLLFNKCFLIMKYIVSIKIHLRMSSFLVGIAFTLIHLHIHLCI